MTAFQQIGLTIIAFVILLIVAATARNQLRKRVAAFWLLVWVAGAIALAWPGVTKQAARALGVGRGTDLLLYCTALATTWGFFWIYTRMRRLDHQLTQLVRRLAIENPQPPPKAASDPVSPNDPT